MEYPYYTLIYKLNKKKIKELVKNFKVKTINNPKLKNEYIAFLDKWNDHYELNQITDLFTETIRVKCRFSNKVSPLDYFTKNKERLLKKTEDIYQLREILYKETKLCSNFKISHALSVLNLFKPKKWLDISAGWGDRLLSAIFYGVDLYFATDPNIELQDGYKKIITTFVPKKKQNNFIILPEGFENAVIPYDDFDIVFTSPPFFDLEKYSTFKSNSFEKYKTENKWYTDFLLVSLEKSYKHLKKGGHMILYIGYFKQINEMHIFLQKIMKYIGIIYFYDTKVRGLYVFQKI